MSHALHAEWTKLRSEPGNIWLIAAIVVLTVAVSAGGSAADTCQTDCLQDDVKLSLMGINLGQAAVAVLAVLVIGGEYSTGMSRVTFAAMPRRSFVLAAKALVLSGVVLVAGTLAILASLLAGRLILPGNGFTPEQGYPPLSLLDGPTLRAVVGSVLYLVLIALLALGAATAVRDAAIAIGVVLGLLYIFPIIAQVIADPSWERRLQKISPTNAGLAVQATRHLADQPLAPWAGLGVLALWAAAALALGALLLHLRDA